MMIITAVALLLAVPEIEAHTPAKLVLLRAVYRDHVAFVQGTIGGEGPYWFLLDTGASRSALDASVAKALHLKDTGGGRVTGTAGSVDVKYVDLPLLKLGQMSFVGLKPTVHDLSGSLAPDSAKIAGILGYDALGDHAVFFDTKESRIGFASDAKLLYTNGETVPFKLENNIPRVTAQIDGVKTELRLDTGASIRPSHTTYVNITQDVLTSMKLQHGSMKPVQNFSACGTGGNIDIPVYQAKQLRVGSHVFRNPRAIVQPKAGYFSTKGAIGFLGGYTLQNFGGFIVDYPGSRLILIRANNAKYR